MSKKKATIKDIALKVGVSATTVSNVINKKGGRVSKEIIDKVNDAIKELDYKKNYSAQSLVINKSNLIGVVIPQTEQTRELLLYNPFYSEFISALEYEFRQNGYNIIVSGSPKDENNINNLLRWNVDGVIILGIYEEAFYENIKKMDIPVVLVDTYTNDEYFYNIRIDDEYGGYLATKYLLEKGHRNIGIITGILKKNGVAEKKYNGYKKALEEYGISINEEFIYEKSVDYEWGYEAGNIIAKQKNHITAIFATADIIASGLFIALFENNIIVPQQMSVIGFDNTFLGKLTIPSLTTINQNIRNKAVISAKTMVDILNNKQIKNKTNILSVDLIERNSVIKNI
ncbi:MAG: LacI family transcriptional regulator [Vallitalea sp.]|jgi:LacI family transcriptional regulator|nr:LacI family transcriptional regulator [Vallitalea sp.]